MPAPPRPGHPSSPPDEAQPYSLDAQVGFLLRQVHQRHTAIFAARFGDDLTPTQWAVLARLHEGGQCSQNRLGRLTAMDVATIKGVVERLGKRGYVGLKPDPTDGRRVLVALTEAGRDAFARHGSAARGVTEDTLAPLDAAEREALMRLLAKLR